MKKQSDVVLEKSLAQPLSITISITPKDADFLRDHTFWMGESPEQLVSRLYANYAKPDGEGEDRLWDIARDPERRAVAFKRNNLSASKIASLNRSLDATFEKLRQVWEHETVKSLKRLPPQKRGDFLRNVPPEDVQRLLILAEA
jgi:hypothetical protein